MIVIPPRDPNEQYPTDPAAEALGKAYEQFTNVQNLSEFHAALRKRDALYELQHQEMGDNPQDFESLHPRDFYRQFDRRADDDDKTVVSEAPYRIREQLNNALWAERDTAQKRALQRYKQLFIERQLAQLDEDRLYYFGKLADAANDQDRERYLTALVGRLKLSGDVGLLYKEDADRLIENIPSDLDIFTFNRAYASDPARAQRLLLYGAYPNIRPELRDEMVRAAEESTGPSTANQTDEQANSETPASVASDLRDDANETEADDEALPHPEGESDSISNNSAEAASNNVQEPHEWTGDLGNGEAAKKAEAQAQSEGVLTPNGPYAPFINDNPEVVHPMDDVEALKSAQCPGNPRCKPAAEWNKYFPKMPQPKVTEKTGMQGGVVFPNGWFIPPAWKEEKTTLGTIGEMIHSVPDLKAPFARFLFDRYWLGSGNEVKLTPEQFKEITDYVAKNPQTEVNKLDESKGQKYVKVEVGDKILTRKTYNLDGHPGYGKSLGNVTVFYDEQGKPVGLYDNYNFNLSGRRSVPTNLKIAAVQAACATDANANCKPFDITYGDYVKPPGTYARNGIVYGEDGKPVNEFMKERERKIQEEMKKRGRDPNVPIISGEY